MCLAYDDIIWSICYLKQLAEDNYKSEAINEFN